MKPENLTLALGEYQLAAVMILDLIKHSNRSKSDSREIQTIIEDAFSKALRNLNVANDVVWRYTGDGYVCTFMGQAASRLLDFLNASIPNITKLLEAYSQQIRVGVDYGLLHLYENRLTSSKEHFDQPGIQAARLESAAEPNEVLCSSTVFQIFQPLYPALFNVDPRRIQTKDRVLTAYIYKPGDYSRIRSMISSLFYETDDAKRGAFSGSLNILVVDDEWGVGSMIEAALEVDGHKITTTLSPVAALDLLKSNSFDVILTDLVMPEMRGDEFATAAKCLRPKTPIVLITGYVEWIAHDNLALSAIDLLLPKPFEIHALRRALIWVAATTSDAAVRQVHSGIRRAGLDLKLNAAIDVWQYIISTMSSSEDLAHIMVRHKAKHLVSQFIESLQPGSNVVESTIHLCNKLNSLYRITNRVRSSHGKQYVNHITEVINDLKKEHKGVKVKCETGSALASLQLNDKVVALLSLIVCELIDNAVEALNGRGRVEIYIDVLTSKQCLYVEVRDNGQGLPKGYEAAAFSEKYSTRGPGRGLGLFLVKEGIGKLGGTIEYRHEKGAVFKVILPLVDIEPRTASRGRVVVPK